MIILKYEKEDYSVHIQIKNLNVYVFNIIQKKMIIYFASIRFGTNTIIKLISFIPYIIIYNFNLHNNKVNKILN